MVWEQTMRNTCFIIALFLLCLDSTFANDTYFFMAGGNIVPTQEKDTLVEMREETIYLKLQDNHYEVTVDFTFFNSGKDTELAVGFPFFQEGIQGTGKIWDFECWTNGEKMIPKAESLESKWIKATGLSYAYTRSVFFPSR